MSDTNLAPSAGADAGSMPDSAPAAPAGLDSAVDTLLATSAEPDSGDQPDEEQPDASTEQPEEPVEEDQPADEQPVEGAEGDEPDPEDVSDIDKSLENGGKANPLDLNSSRGKRIYQAYKAQKEIEQAIGRELTVDDAKSHFEAFTDKMAMEYEFDSADPAKAANWAGYWNQRSPEGMRTVASQMPDILAQQNPAAYEAMAMPVLGRYVNALYTRAGAEQNPDVKKALQYAARVAEWDLYGKYRGDNELEQQIDPLAEREAQIDQKLNTIKTFEQQQIEAQRNQWTSGLETANDSALAAESDKALESLKSAYPARIFKALREDFIGDVKRHMAKDVEGNRIYNIRKNQALRRLSSEDQQQLSGLYQQNVSRAVRAVLPVFLKEAGVTAKASSSARHTALGQAASAGKAPNSSGAPRQQSILPTKKQYANKAAQFDDTIDQLLGSGKAA